MPALRLENVITKKSYHKNAHTKAKDSLEQTEATDMPNHLPKFQVTRKRCNHSRNERLDAQMRVA